MFDIKKKHVACDVANMKWKCVNITNICVYYRRVMYISMAMNENGVSHHM